MGNLSSSSLALWAMGAGFVLFIAILAVMDARKKAKAAQLEAQIASRSLQELQAKLGGLEAVLQSYREAAGALVHGAAFKDDFQAITAINDAAKYDLQMLEDFSTATPDIKEGLAYVSKSRKREIIGFRAAFPWILPLYAASSAEVAISAREARKAEGITAIMTDATASLALQLHANLEREAIAHSHAVNVIKTAKAIVDNG